MMRLVETIPAKLPPLVRDYLGGNPELKELYTHRPSIEGLKQAVKARENFPCDRQTLCDVLSEQASASRYANEHTQLQINRLRNKNVFTVCTGHQLCVYGGPMFFFHKILSAVRVCAEMEKQGTNAVPVYWMASEDHDFEEVNHIWLKGQKLAWQTDARGAVGDLDCGTLSEFKNAVRNTLQGDYRYIPILNELDSIYSAGRTLAEATRDLVYRAFAALGVVVIDPNDARLKALFAPHIIHELDSQPSQAALTATNDKLSAMSHKPQIAGRGINLFWIDKNVRERIVKTESGFATADEKLRWDKVELLALAAKNPQQFSPNVVLRPLYQECILPNIAYIGGPGEVSYWLQLKDVFRVENIPIPVVLMRDMFLLTNIHIEKKIKQLSITYARLNEGFEVLFADLVKAAGTGDAAIAAHTAKITAEMEALVVSVAAFDKGLAESAKAEQARIANRLDALAQKVFRANKRKHEVLAQRLQSVFDEVFPSGQPQERVYNWLNFMTDVAFVAALLPHCTPFDNTVKIVDIDSAK